MYGGDGVEPVADGGFGRKLGEYRGRPILMGVRQGEREFCVVLYWNDSERDEGVKIATVDDAHGQQAHVDLYGEGGKVDTEVLQDVETVYDAEQYVKENWREISRQHFES